MIGVDCDSSALQQAQFNVKELELEYRISLIQATVGKYSRNAQKSNATKISNFGGRLQGNPGRGRRRQIRTQHQGRHHHTVPTHDGGGFDDNEEWIFPMSENCVDTVLTNPPFGTKDKEGIDVQFLKLACRLARHSVYSFHKSSTSDYIIRSAQALENVHEADVIAEMKFDLPRTYKFHKQNSVDVEVVLIRVQLVGDQKLEDHEQISDEYADDNNVETS